MFTWVWTKKFSRMAERLQSLEDTREQNLFSPDLSAQTLEVAPDFWTRQHEAFCYVDRQIKRVNRQTRVWGSLALLAVLADAVIVVGGLTAVQGFRQFQADRQLQTLSVQNSGVDPIADLQKQLSVNDLRMQMNALRQLAVIQDAKAIGLLASVASGTNYPSELRQAATQFLAQAPDSRLVALADLLNSPDPIVRMQAAQAMNNLGGGSIVIPPNSFPSAQDPNANIVAALPAPLSPVEAQIQAIQTLGQMRSPDAIPPLLTKLASSDASIQAAAATALGDIGDPSVIQDLETMLLTSNDDGVRQAAIASIANLFSAGDGSRTTNNVTP